MLAKIDEEVAQEQKEEENGIGEWT
jgi:hypothetical protein